MKKISIEEKAKAYDEAIERTKHYKEGITDRKLENDENIMDYIFPELNKNEDEKIRKEIIELIMQPTWQTEKEFYRRKKLESWVEEQSEQKFNWSKEDKDLMNAAIINLTELKHRFGEEHYNVGKCIDWLELLKDKIKLQ